MPDITNMLHEYLILMYKVIEAIKLVNTSFIN